MSREATSVLFRGWGVKGDRHQRSPNLTASPSFRPRGARPLGVVRLRVTQTGTPSVFSRSRIAARYCCSIHIALRVVLVEQFLEGEGAVGVLVEQVLLQARLWLALADVERELILRPHGDRPEGHIGRLRDHRLLHPAHPERVVGEVDEVVERGLRSSSKTRNGVA